MFDLKVSKHIMCRTKSMFLLRKTKSLIIVLREIKSKIRKHICKKKKKCMSRVIW